MSLAPVMMCQMFYSLFVHVHVCIAESSSSKIILSLVRSQNLMSPQVKYFTPVDTKTISLQNSRTFMPGL